MRHTMSKLTVLACAVALPLALVASAQADEVSTTVTPVEATFTDTTCPFPITEQIKGKRIEVRRFDDDSELVSRTLHVPLIATLTNPENGTTATGHQAINPVLDPTTGGTLSFAGLRFILTAPQFGLVLLDAGRIEFGEGGIVSMAGQHQLVLGDVEAFCAYFAA